MKRSRLLMVVMLLFVAASCSSKKKEAYHGSMDESIELSEVSTSSSSDGIEGEEVDLALEGSDISDGNSESVDYVADAEESDLKGIEEGDSENQDLMVVDVDQENNANSELAQEEVLAQESSGIQEEQISLSEEIAEYSVQKGDTLMEIAFKIYGDFGKWKDIKSLNPDVNGALKMGSVIKYNVPESKFQWVPKGNPYLVMRGDTLGSISHKVYERASWWVHIHENNKPMIKDPDQIFAGFTLYVLPKEQIEKKRELASQ